MSFDSALDAVQPARLREGDFSTTITSASQFPVSRRLANCPADSRVVTAIGMLRQLTVLPCAAALGKPPHIQDVTILTDKARSLVSH